MSDSPMDTSYDLPNVPLADDDEDLEPQPSQLHFTAPPVNSNFPNVLCHPTQRFPFPITINTAPVTNIYPTHFGFHHTRHQPGINQVSLNPQQPGNIGIVGGNVHPPSISHPYPGTENFIAAPSNQFVLERPTNPTDLHNAINKFSKFIANSNTTEPLDTKQEIPDAFILTAPTNPESYTPAYVWDAYQQFFKFMENVQKANTPKNQWYGDLVEMMNTNCEARNQVELEVLRAQTHEKNVLITQLKKTITESTDVSLEYQMNDLRREAQNATEYSKLCEEELERANRELGRLRSGSQQKDDKIRLLEKELGDKINLINRLQQTIIAMPRASNH